MSGSTGASLGLERPRLIGELVVEQLRNAIIEKRLAPGARLSEAALASTLRVSKTPVREALLQLRMIGLVTAEAGSLRVVLPSLALVREAYEVRAGLEALTAFLSATRADEQDLVAIKHAAVQSASCARNHDMDGFREHDRLFHQYVSVASKNQMAAQQVMNSRDLCQALRQRDVITDQVSQACGRAHLSIAEAIAGKDSDSARALMGDHIHYVRERVEGSMTQVETDARRAGASIAL